MLTEGVRFPRVFFGSRGGVTDEGAGENTAFFVAQSCSVAECFIEAQPGQGCDGSCSPLGKSRQSQHKSRIRWKEEQEEQVLQDFPACRGPGEF
ncbi:hypothetical protein NDU88_004521 [Pleurodeles waltl]|uniref:Uncharacterized protein n=1 Tax=Pleurodeles waltl TaxID=8319 RepID=A0AAV7WWU3_PLEWA|nr:hypothetical protein NDU88_004521 [Pleurodeles waltl]